MQTEQDGKDTSGNGTLAEAGDAPVKDNASNELVFGKWKSMEEAEKGVKELQHLYGRQAEELGAARRALDEKAALAKLSESIDKLASKGETKAEDKSYDSFVEKLQEEARQDPGSAIPKMLNLVNSWTADEGRKVEDRIKKEYVSKLESVTSELATIRSSLEKQDPVYQQNKELIDSFVADGMTLSKAKEWAKNLSSGRTTPPSSISSSRVVQHTTQTTYLSPDERAQFKSEGYTDVMLDQMEAEFKARKGNK